jgi:amino acid adenylation domain-containing protein
LPNRGIVLFVDGHTRYILQIREAANMLSRDGKVRAFDEGANGYVRGEGAGALVIKSLRRAKEDRAAGLGGEILAVIRGSAMNQDGRSASFTAPNGSAQRALLRSALQNSGVSPDQVAYLEAHGTGTPLGDPIEWGAIRDVLLADRGAAGQSRPLLIGAVKSNIGHLEAAAGMAGLIKAVCCLRRRTVPSNLHFSQMNSRMIVDPTHRAALFPTEATQLVSAAGEELVASVSSFGSGGTNTNVILQSYTDTSVRQPAVDAGDPKEQRPKVVFVCTGQGLVYKHMGLQLFEAEPSFKDVILRCSDALPELRPSLVDVMYSGTPVTADLIGSPQYSQLALYALEVALANVWKSRGVTADAVCGHSLGEYAAAVVAGVLAPEAGARLVHVRQLCLQELGASVSADGAMLAIRCTEADAVQALASTADRHLAALAGVNGPSAVVLSGERRVLEAVLSKLGKPTHKFLTVDYAYHSPLVRPAAEEFARRFAKDVESGEVVFSEPTTGVVFVSCKTGAAVSPQLLKTPEYWVQQMQSPVRFHDCTLALMASFPVAPLCVELGPHDTLVKQMTAAMCSTGLLTASLQQDRDALDTFNAAFSAVRARLQSNHSCLGGRLSPEYRPVAMPWRRKRESTRSLAAAETTLRRESFTTRHGAVYFVARGALLSVLSPDSAELLTDNTSFLSLGLDSLAAQAVRNAIANSLELPHLSNTVVLKHPTLEELVEHLEDCLSAAAAERNAAPSSPSRRPAAPQEAVFDVDDLLEDGVEAEFPATCMQQAMLFHHVSDPDAKSFIESFRWEVSGLLDVKRFYAAWQAVIRATPALRSTFDPYAVPVPVQRVWQAESIPALSCPMDKAPWYRVVAYTGDERAEADLGKVVDTELKVQRDWQFDLSSPLLLRMTVVTVSAQRHVVLVTLHHAVIDGFSIRAALQAVGDCYKNAEPNASVLEGQVGVSYGVFAEFERQLVRSDKVAQRYWRNVLQGWQAGPHALVNMPAMKVNLPDEDVVRVHRTVDAQLLQSLQTAARRASVTLAAFFHAAWGAVYAKLTCSEDILYGNTTAGRSARLSEIGSIVGPVINTFPMRYTVSAGHSVRDYLHTVQRTLLNSLEFENYPLAEIQKLSPSPGSLFSVIFDFQTSTWNHTFISADGSEIVMSDSKLVDRIGCPVSVRVVLDGDTLQLHATSECREYGHTVLESMLQSLVSVASFMADVVTGGNPLHRDVRARVFDLMDLVPLCRNRKLSMVTFTEDEEKQLESVHVPVTAASSAPVEVEYVLPNLSNVSVPTHFPIVLEAEDLQSFGRRCEELGCEPSTAVLALYLWAVRRFASEVTVGVNYTSTSTSCATRHLTLELPTDVSFHVLLAAVSSAVAVDQSHIATKSKSSVVFSCAANPVLPAETTVALIVHETASQIALDLKFPTSKVPLEVMEGVHDVLQVLLNHVVSSSGFDPSQSVTDLVPLPPAVDGLRPDCRVSARLMHDDVYANAQLDGCRDSQAVVQYNAAGEATILTYAKLVEVADNVAASLASHVACAKAATSAFSTCVIAVVMEKGWEQVAAVLAVLRLQCAYLPMDARLWPEQRIRQVLELSEAVAVLTQPHLLASSALSWMAGLSVPVTAVCQSQSPQQTDFTALQSLPSVNADALAYLIYTSGSTGIPKGVCCHHRGAMNTIDDLNSLFSVTAADKVLALSSLSFDLSVYDIFGLLSAGGTVVIPDPHKVSPPDPSEWFDLVETEQITIWNTVPAFMELLVSHAEYMGLKLPACLRLVYMSGDWIPVTLPNRIRAVSDRADIRIISMGGATEASIWSNIFELENTASGGVPADWSSIPYGKPMRNQRMYVLNERMENCDVWVTGGIYIGGVGVAQGYYKNPERTAYQFVLHKVTGEFLFRTGDLGRVRPGGLIEILGREDSQVKVNGFRIELGEIERVLLEHKDVASAALAVHNNALCAYLVMRNDAELDAITLRTMCKTRLAEYMVPQHFMVMDEIPLSANGKVQRDKLPAPQMEGARLEGAGEGVLTEKEQILADIWGGLLGINSAAIPLDANFFSLGGDSLRSVQVVAQAKKYGLLLSVPQVFSHPTLRELADVANSFRQLGPEVLGTSSDSVTAKPIFTLEHRDDLMYEEYPLIGINQAHFVGLHTSSYARDGMTPQIYFEWEIGQPGLAATSGDDVFKGQVSVARLEHAIDCFVQRHATFRSVVCKNGTMRVLPQVPHFTISHVQEFDSDADAAAGRAMAYRTHMMDNGPTVHEWPLFEVRVTHTSATSSLVHINVSLFLMDAMSDLILRQELSALYRAASDADVTEVLPPPARIHFKDYCSALTDKLPHTKEYLRAKDYWLSRIDDLSSGPELPTLPPQLEGKESGILTGKFVNFHRWLSVQEWKRARKNCAFHSVTMPAVLLAAYSLVLYRWGSRDRFLVNILQCLRHQVHEDVNKMVGNCSSTILCDIDLRQPEKGALTFRLAVQRVAQELSQNLEHASMSGVEVMQELNRIRGKTFKAVAPFIFTTPIGVEKGNKQVMSRDWMFQEKFFSERVPHTACVNAIKADPNGTACASLDVVDGVFPKEVMSGMYDTYHAIVDLICAEDPEAWHAPINCKVPLPVPVSPIREDCAVSDRLLHADFFFHSASPTASSGAAVVQYSDQSRTQYSYQSVQGIAELAASQLAAHVLSAKSAAPTGTCVIAVVMEKGWEQVAAVLAVLRLQCAYLPMDARLWPEQRIRQVLELSEAVAVLTQPHLLASSTLSWMAGLSIPVVTVQCTTQDLDNVNAQGLDVLPAVPADALAYLIYTSGSTGVPKGVCCHHRGAMNTIDDLNSLFSVTAADKVLALSSLSFDLSVYDIFGLLSAGGTVVIPDPNTVSPPDPSKWYDIVVAEQVTIWNTVPAFMELLVSHAEYMGLKLPACLRLVYMSGDWIPVTLPNRIRSVSDCADIRIISMGGATEASIWSNIFELESAASGGVPAGWSSIPYGLPMRNQRMYVLNERMENCDMWVTGGIYIGGVGVAQGYYKNPERTAYQFVRHKATGEFLFRTGDLGRVRPGGLIEILGREDSQVKVNGFRIELGEIERVLLEHKDVASAALAVHNNTLCAYLVMHSTFDQGADEVAEDTVFEVLQAACKVKLAEYMVPKHFMFIDEVPLSANGKVQRELLPSPQQLLDAARKRSNSITDRLVSPANELEERVRGIFAGILKCGEDTICCKRSTFFDLGGNSLTSIQLIFALRDAFGVTIGVQDLFRSPTVIGVCGLLTLDKNFDVNGTGNSKHKEAAASDKQASAQAHIEQLQLNEGSRDAVPLILFNPAGASGLW